VRGRDGQPGGGPGHADPRRHGLHPRAPDRALVPAGPADADLRGHRRDAAPHHFARPAARVHQDRRAPGMTQLSPATVLAEAARKYPDKLAVIDSATTERITYRDLWRQTLAYAAGLRELGIGPGDTVAIQIPNLADFPRVYYAVL